MNDEQTHVEADLGAMEKTANQFLDTVIDQIRARQETARDVKLADMEYPELYKNLNSVLEGYNTIFSECRKYNEAKIHRKYQIITADLEEEIKMLREKVDQERRARLPSRKYVEQLVDQLVDLKHENANLRNVIQRLKDEKEAAVESGKLCSNPEEMSPRIGDSLGGESTTGDPANRDLISRISLDGQDSLMFNTINQFLSNKRAERRIRSENKSPFERYLTKSKSLLSSWDLPSLLENINEWSKDLIPRHQDLKTSRMKSRILSTLEDEIAHMNLPKIGANRDKTSLGTNPERQIRLFKDRRRDPKNGSTLSARHQCFKSKLT